MRLSLLFFLWCGCALACSAGDAGSPATSGIDVVVVRLDEVLLGSKRYVARLTQLKEEAAESEGALKQLSQQIRQQTDQLERLNPTSDAFMDLDEQREILKAKGQLMAMHTKSQFARRHRSLLKEVIFRPLADFAKERRIRLVTLASDPDIKDGSPADVLRQLGMQYSLYYDPALDVTGQFIAYLNAPVATGTPPLPPRP